MTGNEPVTVKVSMDEVLKLPELRVSLQHFSFIQIKFSIG